MSGHQHTPGPWRVRNLPTGDRILESEASGPVLEIATVHRSAEYADTLPANENAALMAAAPDLLRLAYTGRRLLCGMAQKLWDAMVDEEREEVIQHTAELRALWTEILVEE